MLHNLHNYAEDLVLNDPASTGIKFPCVFNTFPNYHVTYNVIFDLMHDVLEGVCNFGMLEVIDYLVGKGYITVHLLDNLIQCFPFSNYKTRSY